MSQQVEVALYEIAHARSGDKGDRLNIALVCRHPDAFPVIASQITAECVSALFASRRPTHVERYDLPKLMAFNFVLDGVLEGGVNASLGLDGHGKSLSFHLLTARLRLDRSLLDRIIRQHTINGRSPQ